MSDYSAGTATIEASAEEIFAILKDLDSYPQWSASIKSVEIAERDGSGNPSKANLKVEAGVLKDKVSLDYDWSKAPNEISFTLEAVSYTHLTLPTTSRV